MRADNSVQVMIFAKWPELGKVKTRLARAIGEEAALLAYLELLSATIEQLQDWQPLIMWSHRSVLPSSQSKNRLELSMTQCVAELESKFDFALQSEGNLGQRMRQAFARSLQVSERAIIVGADCPVVSDEHIQQVSAALEDADVALIPSDDGGYVTIGTQRPLPETFDEARWGSAYALNDTVRLLQREGLSVMSLDPLWDVDTVEDWERWKRAR